jgi:putative ABC transport system substrate-binding protein
VASAQPKAMPVIGFLSARSPGESARLVEAFRQGLRETGFVEGQNLSIAFRWAEGRYESLPALAAELVQLHVAVLLCAGGTPAALAAKAATSTIPIVFSSAGDPVASGLVASIGRPGGNVTGMSNFSKDLGGKRVELMHELVPNAGVLGYLVNPSNPGWQAEAQDAQSAANVLGVRLQVLKASTEPELERAFNDAVQQRNGMLAISVDGFFDARHDLLVALAARHSLPTFHGWRQHVTAGGLVSYGTSLHDSYRQAGIYCGRILKGEKPADLPVQQPTAFELVINLKTAKALGLIIPPSILDRANEVIQ